MENGWATQWNGVGRLIEVDPPETSWLALLRHQPQYRSLMHHTEELLSSTCRPTQSVREIAHGETGFLRGEFKRLQQHRRLFARIADHRLGGEARLGT